MDALVIIDVQQGMFTFPGFTPHDGEAVVARIAGLLRTARASRTPIFFVQHAGGKGDPLTADGPGFAFRPELTPELDESVTVKRYCSAFRETDFDFRLRDAEIDHVIVCGMQTEFCIDTAVRGAAERGFRVTLVSDAHTTFDTRALSAEQIIAHHNRVLGDGFAGAKRADEITFTHAVAAPPPRGYTLETAEADDAHTRAVIGSGLRHFNGQMLGASGSRPLMITLRSSDGEVIGGLLGRSYYRWLFVELLFVPEALRGQGVGGQLLAAAEAEARKRDLIGIWLDTFNPEAGAFYERCGFREIGAIDDYPPGNRRLFLARRL